MKGEQPQELKRGEGVCKEKEEDIVRPSGFAFDKRRQSVAEERRVGEGETSHSAEARHVARGAMKWIGWEHAEAAAAEDRKAAWTGGVDHERGIDHDYLARFDLTGSDQGTAPAWFFNQMKRWRWRSEWVRHWLVRQHWVWVGGHWFEGKGRRGGTQ